MITGTFLDEISRDVASANWGPDEWRREFFSMRADGIDTVVLTRLGLGDRAAFDSKVLRKLHPSLVAHEDQVGLFLGLAAEHAMSMWIGTYDAGLPSDGAQKEADVHRALADEVWARYGRSSAFRGWYFCREVEGPEDGSMRPCTDVCDHLRSVSGLPILVAPRLRPAPRPAEPKRLADSRRERGRLLARMREIADVVLMNDGEVAIADLAEHLAQNAELARENDLTLWSNVETFDRDVPAKFPPIAWPKLRARMESALAAGVEKLITFEYSHYMSPNSMYPSAQALHRRYREWLATQR